MKKLFSCLFLLLFFIGIFKVSSDVHKAEAAGCIFITNSISINQGTITTATEGKIQAVAELTTGDPQEVQISIPITFTPECLNKITFKASMIHNGKLIESDALTVTSESHSISAKISPDFCTETYTGTIYKGYWRCDGIIIQGIQTINGVNQQSTKIQSTPIYLLIKTEDDTLAKAFRKTLSSISWDGKNIIKDPTKCSIDSVKLTTGPGVGTYSGDPLFTIDSTGNISKDQYYRITLNTISCLGGSIPLRVATFGSSSHDLIKGNIPISNNAQYIDFSMGGLDLATHCNSVKTEGEFTFYKCTMLYEAKAADDFFNTQDDGITFYVKIPTKNPSLIIAGGSVINSNVTATSLGQFGSTGIKEGFSWDPCYDPKSQKQVTYLGKTSDGGVDVSDIGKSTPLSDPKVTPVTAECYTLLSNLPIKLQGTTDKISQQIGYAPARGQDNQIIPGLVKTVIVGNFFIGDFILYLFRLLVGVVGLVAVAVLIYIGIAIATSKENPYKLKELKAWLGRVFGGIAIILASYLVLSIIDPKLTDFGFGTGSGFNLSEQGFPPIALNTAQGTITGGYSGGGKTSNAPLSEEVYKIALAAEAKTGVKAASILALFNQESSNGKNVGGCNIPGKPGWRDIMPDAQTSSSWHNTDQGYFITIMSSLGRIDKIDTQPLSCRLGDGYGGAMGPLQFLPTVWYSLIPQIAAATGHNPPDPWNLTDAIFAASILLKNNNGANDLYNAACKYYSGRACDDKTTNPNKFYGNDVVAEAARLQKIIDAKK